MHAHFAEIIKPGSGEAELLAAIDVTRLPRHIAVIMDGNGRWAKAANLRTQGRGRVGAVDTRHVCTFTD